MDTTFSRPVRHLCGLCLWALVILVFFTGPPWLDGWLSVQASPVVAQAEGGRKQDERFDLQVRDDFFAGMMGDTARLDRGMKRCEEILAKNPRDADALVWHGGGLLTRAAHAYTTGDAALGDRLWNQGIKEMNDARAFDPSNLRVKIGRSATLIGVAQSGWESSDARARALLRSALLDYEEVYRRQKPHFGSLSAHSRGELLFGLASGWSILGDHKRARAYLLRILQECRDTEYEAEARPWLAKRPPAVIQHDCRGCHIRASG